MMTDRLIVGVDGSAPSRHAVRWAAREAARRQVQLRVVNAFNFVVVGAYAPIAAEVAQDAENAAKIIVDEAIGEATAAAPGIEVTGAAVVGPAAEVLIEAGRDAALVVVGSKGHNGFAAALVGATGLQVATHAPCPVVVIRGRSDTAVGPVVVGVDGSAASRHALNLAFQQAAARRCGLTAVRTVHQSRPPFGKGPVVAVEVLEELLAQARTELAQHVAATAQKYPQVSVDQVVTEGGAADVLVELSRGAQLVVVGTRGHGGFTGLLLGSVGVHLIHHADCPVLVARGR
jgi:nucleotide-binding universal stress UspA family protein